MSNKASLAVKLGLFVVIVLLVYKLVDVITKPVRFEKIREQRHEVVKKRLEQIRELQVAYRNEYKEYANTFDELFLYADTGEIRIEERKDSSFMYYDEVYQTDMLKDTVIVRLLGTEPVKDNIFGKDFDIQALRYIPFTKREEEFEIASSFVYRNESRLPTFEVSAKDLKILGDLKDEYEQFIDRDFQLQIGNIAEPTISGNW